MWFLLFSSIKRVINNKMLEEVKLEQKLKSAIAQNDDKQASLLLKNLLEKSPNNRFANHCLIKHFYREGLFSDCIALCQKIQKLDSSDTLSLKLLVLSYIALKQYTMAMNHINRLLQIESQNIEYLLLKAEVEVALGNFDTALEVYREISNLDSKFFNFNMGIKDKIIQQHTTNAKNLCKRKAFDMVSVCKGISQRLDLAIDGFFGLTKLAQNHELQHPSFFCLPQLPAKTFYTLDDLPELESIIRALQNNIDEIKNIINIHKSQSYLDTIPTKNNEKEWLELAKKWDSIHLIKGGKVVSEIKKELLNTFQNHLLADCPPHAPEVFLSTLQPGAKIPPHYGLSNIKLTVHLPILVDKESFIKVGDDIKNWVDNDFLVFDDSFIHLAENHSKEPRTVLIFDIWHPDLSFEEKEGIKSFMNLYQKWNDIYKNIL